MRSRAFTLLEVMVAVAILGLALTVILSAQAGLYAASSHTQNESVAIGMARCKMGEIEEDLLRMGYQELDQVDEGACCEDQTPDKMRCSWKVERVELPDPPSFAEENPAGEGASLDMNTPSSMLPGGAGPLGALMAAGANDAGVLSAAGGADGGLKALSSMLGESSAGEGMGGVAPMVMSMVYPTFKPMLESSIRKVTVTVQWKEGINDRDLAVVQYVTNPMRGGFNMGMEGMDPEASGLGGLLGGLDGNSSPSTPRPTNTATRSGK